MLVRILLSLFTQYRNDDSNNNNKIKQTKLQTCMYSEKNTEDKQNRTRRPRTTIIKLRFLCQSFVVWSFSSRGFTMSSDGGSFVSQSWDWCSWPSLGNWSSSATSRAVAERDGKWSLELPMTTELEPLLVVIRCWEQHIGLALSSDATPSTQSTKWHGISIMHKYKQVVATCSRVS